MTAIGVISNRQSTGNQQGLQKVRRVMARHSDVPHLETASTEDLDAALDDLARKDVQVLALNGGDGTVQAVLTRLQRSSPFRHMPAIAVLRGGNTSMIAEDCGLAGPPHRALHRLLARTRDVAAVERPLVGMQLAPEAPPIYGMFFGTASIIGAIDLTRRSLHPMGLTGSVGPSLMLAVLLLRLLFGQTDGEVLKAERLGLAFDNEPPERREHLLFFATTLERLFAGLQPYWGNGAGDLRCTGVLMPYRRLWRVLPALLKGRKSRHLTQANGYYSRNAQRITLEIDCSCTLDGELFRPQAGQPVLLTSERRATFVCG